MKDCFEFRKTKSLEERKKVYNDLTVTYPGKIPVLIERHPKAKCPLIPNSVKYIVYDKSFNAYMMMDFIELKLGLVLGPGKLLYLFVNGTKELIGDEIISDLYDDYKDPDDGMLYIFYTDNPNDIYNDPNYIKENENENDLSKSDDISCSRSLNEDFTSSLKEMSYVIFSKTQKMSKENKYFKKYVDLNKVIPIITKLKSNLLEYQNDLVNLLKGKKLESKKNKKENEKEGEISLSFKNDKKTEKSDQILEYKKKSSVSDDESISSKSEKSEDSDY